MIKKPQLYLLIAIIFLIIAVFSVLLFSEGDEETKEPPVKVPTFSPLPSGAIKSLDIKPILTNEVPLKAVDEGGGVDLESAIVQQSRIEVEKILPLLPYGAEIETAAGTVSVLIPGAQFQETPWVLDVQIFGVDYQVAEEDADYDLQRSSFRLAAANVFGFIEKEGVDPEKVIINWGDRAYIRERAEKWLSE